MHDVRLIRQQPEAFDAALARRNLPPLAASVLSVDEAHRAKVTRIQALQQQRNEVAKRIGVAKRDGQDVAALMEESKAVNQELAALEVAVGADEVATLLAQVPNLPAEDVPMGVDETGNVELRRWGQVPVLPFAPKDHVALGEALGMMDFSGAAALSGARFVVLKGALARLERALAQWFLDTHTREFGYEEVAPPFLVRDAAVFGTGQLPKFGDDLFRTTNGYWLIPTAEVPLTNLVADRIVTESQLPLRMTAYTPCFRSEAGAAGRDTRGMIRLHQFSKVELVSVVRPEESAAEHERMTACAEALLQRLELPYRVVVLCTGDMGFSAQKTYDIEVWMAGQQAYRETSSCSNCGAFQARRMKARFRRAGQKDTEFVHTLNGSGLPTGRTLVAILEHYQQEDGSVRVPEVLRPYMGGVERLEAA